MCYCFYVFFAEEIICSNCKRLLTLKSLPIYHFAQNIVNLDTITYRSANFFLYSRIISNGDNTHDPGSTLKMSHDQTQALRGALLLVIKDSGYYW